MLYTVSWDLVYGFVTDLVTFGFIHQTMSMSLGVTEGPIKVNIGSLHLYDETKDLAIEKGPPYMFAITDSVFTNTFSETSRVCRDMARFYSEHSAEPPFKLLTWSAESDKIFELVGVHTLPNRCE